MEIGNLGKRMLPVMYMFASVYRNEAMAAAARGTNSLQSALPVAPEEMAEGVNSFMSWLASQP